MPLSLKGSRKLPRFGVHIYGEYKAAVCPEPTSSQVEPRLGQRLRQAQSGVISNSTQSSGPGGTHGRACCKAVGEASLQWKEADLLTAAYMGLRRMEKCGMCCPQKVKRPHICCACLSVDGRLDVSGRYFPEGAAPRPSADHALPRNLTEVASPWPLHGPTAVLCAVNFVSLDESLPPRHSQRAPAVGCHLYDVKGGSGLV